MNSQEPRAEPAWDDKQEAYIKGLDGMLDMLRASFQPSTKVTLPKEEFDNLCAAHVDIGQRFYEVSEKNKALHQQIAKQQSTLQKKVNALEEYTVGLEVGVASLTAEVLDLDIYNKGLQLEVGLLAAELGATIAARDFLAEENAILQRQIPLPQPTCHFPLCGCEDFAVCRRYRKP